MIDLIACLLFELESGSQHPFAKRQTLLLMLNRNALPDVATREGEAVLLWWERRFAAHGTSVGSPTPSLPVFLRGGKQRLRIQQIRQVQQRDDGHAGAGFVDELLAEGRVQHPRGHGQLDTAPDDLHDYAVCRVTPEAANDLYLFASEGMVPVVDLRGRRFMGSMGMG